MSTPWFFLSYARTDSTGHEHLKKFYLDLAKEVRRIAGLDKDTKETEIGFLDTTSIETGAHWREKIAGPLKNSRVFICLYSRGYFGSPFCGKEFEVFRTRVNDYVKNSPPRIDTPPLIIPVLRQEYL